jgi:hypothetical protein
VEEGYTLNISPSNIDEGVTWMNPDAYYAIILNVLVGLIFVALVLGFLYMIYGREEKTEET